MTKKIIYKKSMAILFIISFTLMMFIMPQNMGNGIIEGVRICLSTILPTLFPFTILSLFIIKTDAFFFLYKFLSPITEKIFKLSPQTIPVIIMSLIGGFPIGAKMANSLYKNKKITENECQRLIIFCVNGGPAFTINTVGMLFLHSKKAGVILYFSLLLSSLLLGITVSFFSKGERNNVKIDEDSGDIILSLTSAISDASYTMISICAFVIIFNGFTNCIEQLGLPTSANLFINSISEVTKGCLVASKTMSLPIISAIIGFCGFSVHCQILNYIYDCNLKYTVFFAFRVLNATVSALICHMLLLVFPVDISTMGGTIVGGSPFSVSFSAFVSLFIMCFIFIFNIDSKRKIW